MKTEARVIKANGETGFAVFDSASSHGKIVLILDRGDGHDKTPVYYHPTQSALTSESEPGIDWHYLGEPIDLRLYLDLPIERRGFVLVDD